jgi:hypothetical protein
VLIHRNVIRFGRGEKQFIDDRGEQPTKQRPLAVVEAICTKPRWPGLLSRSRKVA